MTTFFFKAECGHKKTSSIQQRGFYLEVPEEYFDGCF